MRTDIAGYVLAGGSSRRMGTNKALLLLEGKPMIERVVTVLRSVLPEVIVVSEKQKEYDFLHLLTIHDIRKKCGPLGGIHAALHHTVHPRVFISACDTPFLSTDLLQYVLGFPSGAPATVASMNGTLHPLCGVYSKESLPIIERQLARGDYSVRASLHLLGAVSVPITPDLPFFRPNLLDNVNDLLSYRRAVETG